MENKLWVKLGVSGVFGSIENSRQARIRHTAPLFPLYFIINPSQIDAVATLILMPIGFLLVYPLYRFLIWNQVYKMEYKFGFCPHYDYVHSIGRELDPPKELTFDQLHILISKFKPKGAKKDHFEQFVTENTLIHVILIFSILVPIALYSVFRVNVLLLILFFVVIGACGVLADKKQNEKEEYYLRQKKNEISADIVFHYSARALDR